MPLVGQVYRSKRATLIQGNCLEVLRDLPDASVDAVVTDPPFGVRDDEWDCMSQQEFARFSMA
jgi:DNA modification methylase